MKGYSRDGQSAILLPNFGNKMTDCDLSNTLSRVDPWAVIIFFWVTNDKDHFVSNMSKFWEKRFYSLFFLRTFLPPKLMENSRLIREEWCYKIELEPGSRQQKSFFLIKDRGKFFWKAVYCEGYHKKNWGLLSYCDCFIWKDRWEYFLVRGYYKKNFALLSYCDCFI